MLNNFSPHKRNSIYIALVVGVFWMLSSFSPMPQMFVLYLLEGTLESLGIEAATTKNVIYLAAAGILAILFNISRSNIGMLLLAIGVTFFMTPPFAYYDNIIPQEPFFMPVFLSGICVTLILCLSGLLKKDQKAES